MKEKITIKLKSKDTSNLDEWGNPIVSYTTKEVYALVRYITEEDFNLINSGIAKVGDIEVVLDSDYNISTDDIITYNGVDYLVKTIMHLSNTYMPVWIYRCSRVRG